MTEFLAAGWSGLKHRFGLLQCCSEDGEDPRQNLLEVTNVQMAEMVRISKVWVNTVNMLFILGNSAASRHV